MKKIKTLLICCGLAACITDSTAQASWSMVASLPEGASVIDLAVDNNNTVYALTYFAGDIYYTTNNGALWQKLPGTHRFSNVVDIEVDKSTNTLYVGTLHRGLHWTSDKGLNWQDEPFYTDQASGLNAYIHKTVRKPASNIIICSEPGMFSTSTLYRSANAGASWSTGTVNFDGAYELKYLSDNTLLAGTGNGVFRSADDGLTWSTGSNILSTLRVRCLLEKTSALLFAAVDYNSGTSDTSGTGVFLSADGGLTWQKSSNGMTDCAITALALDSITGDLFASFYGGVYRSADNGMNWSPVTSGLGDHDFITLAANDSGIFTGSRKAGIAYSGSPVNGWKSRNTGLTVSTVSEMVMSASGNIHVLDRSNTGVYNLSGGTWKPLNNGLPSASGQKLAKDNNGILYTSYIGKSSCLYRSTDQGLTWTAINSLPLPPNIYWATCPIIKTDKFNNVYVVVEVSSQGTYQPPQVYRSADQGASWSLIYTLDENTYTAIRDIDISSGNAIYIAVNNFFSSPEFLVSTNQGMTFSVLPFQSQAPTPADLVIGAGDSLYIMHDNKLFKNAGGQWKQLNSSAWHYDYSLHPTRLYIDRQHNLFVTCQYSGVYYSSDDGATWTSISAGLPIITPPLNVPVMISIYDLQFDNNNVPFAISTDFAPNHSGGIYRFGIPTSTVNTGGEEKEQHLLKVSVFPNPASGFCKFSVSSDLGDSSGYSVFNSSGALMAEGRWEKDAKNERHAMVDVSAYPAGIYFIRTNGGNRTAVSKLIKE